MYLRVCILIFTTTGRPSGGIFPLHPEFQLCFAPFQAVGDSECGLSLADCLVVLIYDIQMK